ncbi:MAG TPA: hypothetical protein VJP02_11220 [Candidatus Sulfotelmatobacter sp.]|nr:hypothetical protein [Candidatus Sulfotelmatobacter sp.]
MPPLHGPAIPTVTFTKSLWGANPSYYSITVSSIGSASYRAEPNSDLRTGEPEIGDFTATGQTRQKIFQLTKKLHFFKGKLKTSDENGRMGWKSLTFAEGPIRSEIDYTSSQNRSIKRLTHLFESIATTLEYGWKLSSLRADDPTALAAELKQMRRQVSRRQLAEFEAITPIVRDIGFDPRIPEASRCYARNLWKETHSLVRAGASSAALCCGGQELPA